MSELTRKETIMRLDIGEVSEMRLIIHCYPKHTTAALVTRTRAGRENFDKRLHAWDLPLPQGYYGKYEITDQLWMILAALAATTRPRRRVTWAEPPEPPGGLQGGCLGQSPLPGFSA